LNNGDVGGKKKKHLEGRIEPWPGKKGPRGREIKGEDGQDIGSRCWWVTSRESHWNRSRSRGGQRRNGISPIGGIRNKTKGGA